MRLPGLLLLAAACADAGHAPSQPPPAADVASVSPESPPEETVLRRSCGRPSFGADWRLDPAAHGVTCRRKADCGSDPLTHCFGVGDACAADSCKSIRTTLCRRDDCADDHDCPAGARCVCPESGGDPWCVPDGCDEDTDCANGQHCRDDDAIRGAGPVQHCTTPDDSCSDSAQCKDPNQACGYDASRHRWSCTALLIID